MIPQKLSNQTEYNDRQKSLFNGAISYLIRLNSLFYVADNNAIKLDLYSWFNVLLAIYRELSTEMKPNEMEKLSAEIPELLNEFSNMRNMIDKSGKVNLNYALYKRLNDFEIELRRIQKDAGLLLKITDDELKSFGISNV